MKRTKNSTNPMQSYHPLVMTLIIYALADVAFSGTVAISAIHMEEMWSNHFYPLLHSSLVTFSILSVYFIAYSNIKLALALHGLLKLMILFWTLHSMIFPEFYFIEKQEAVAAALYYFLTLVFEMTAFFVINKMNIPFIMEDDYFPEIFDEEDEVMVTCC
ncbi:unnamed protein product [Caenorhabditis brenneri]